MANPNIFQQYLKPVRSVAEYQDDAAQRELRGLQLENTRGQNALLQLTRQQQAQAAQQAMVENNALQRIAQETGGDPEKLVGALRASGMPGLMKQADQLETQGLTRKKTTAEVGKIDAEAAAKQAETRYAELDRHARSLAMVQTPQDLMAYADKTLDILGAQGPQRDQARQMMLAKAQELGLEQWKQAAAQQAVPLLDKFKEDAEMKRAQLSADTQIKTTGMTNATSRANNAASNAVQMRGQNLTDARAREATSASLTKPFEVTGPDGLPMLVQQDKQGGIRPVQGFGPKTGAAKPLNDTQAKALLFGSRAQESDKIIEGLGRNYSPLAINAKSAAGKIPLIGGAFEAGANAMLGDKNQSAEQAQRDFVNAILRRESGAVISDSEFDNARKQYFPQPGDGDAVFKQKSENRKLAIRGLLAEVPEGRRNSIAPKGGAGGEWTVEEVKK